MCLCVEEFNIFKLDSWIILWSNNFLNHKGIKRVMWCVQGLSESPDLEFEYADTDKWAAELSGVCDHPDHWDFQTPICYLEFHSVRLGNVLCVQIIYLFFTYISELYSYTEGPEFALNRKCFEVEFRAHGMQLVLKNLLNLGWRRYLYDLQLFCVSSFW